MTEQQAREEVCRVGKSLFERGYAHSTAGSISVLLGEQCLITPTDACLGFLQPEQLVLLRSDGAHAGPLAPSKTAVIHRAIYTASAPTAWPARCVIHTHSSSSVAVSMQAQHPPGLAGVAELLAPITPYFVMKVGHVPLIPYWRPGAPEMAREMRRLIAQYAEQGLHLRALMSARLGPSVWGANLGSAMATLEELEETAKLWLLSAGAASALDAVALSELRSVFGAYW